jgi:hypothetical protein
VGYKARNLCVSFDHRVGRCWGKEADARNRGSDSSPEQYSPPRAAQEVSELTHCEPWAELFPKSGTSLANLLITRMQFGPIADIHGGVCQRQPAGSSWTSALNP